MRLVVPHFGDRPPYFRLVLRSMAANPDVSWLLLTDRVVPEAPANVTVVLCEFDELVKRFQIHFDVEIALTSPYKLCDFRPAFGEIFADELNGYEFWGHCDLDLLFGRIRDHLPPEAFEADKILFQGNFALYRNTADAASWYRHEVGRISYKDVFADPAPRHFDEWGGIYYVIEDLGVRCWQQSVIFDISFARYRTRAEHPPGRDPRRYAWEDGEVCEYHLAGSRILRRTALLIHLQKRVMRPVPRAVLRADRYWILSNGFAVQTGVSPWTVRAAHIPRGHEIVPFYARRLQRAIRRRTRRSSP
jgi:Family of unknown function (DUF6625)